MDIMKKATIITLLMLLFAYGCINFPLKNHVCPNGNIVQEESQCVGNVTKALNLNPGNFSSVMLDGSKVNYVQSNGELKAVIHTTTQEDIWVTTSYPESPEYSKVGYSSFDYRTISLNGKRLTNDISIHAINNSHPPDSYLLNFLAPGIPGDYTIWISYREGSKQLGASYNLTVINATSTEDQALRIADRFVYSELDSRINYDNNHDGALQGFPQISNWSVVSKNVTSKDDLFDVSILVKYDRCNNIDNMDSNNRDFNNGKCIDNNIVTGHYLISKQTGQIIG